MRTTKMIYIFICILLLLSACTPDIAPSENDIPEVQTGSSAPDASVKDKPQAEKPAQSPAQQGLQALHEIVESGQTDTLRMTIYYTNPFALTPIVYSVETLIECCDEILVVDGAELNHYENILADLTPDLLKEAEDTYLHTTLTYLLQTEADGTVLEVAFSDVCIFINGEQMKYDDAFYQAVRPFLPAGPSETFDAFFAYQLPVSDDQNSNVTLESEYILPADKFEAWLVSLGTANTKIATRDTVFLDTEIAVHKVQLSYHEDTGTYNNIAVLSLLQGENLSCCVPSYQNCIRLLEGENGRVPLFWHDITATWIGDCVVINIPKRYLNALDLSQEDIYDSLGSEWIEFDLSFGNGSSICSAYGQRNIINFQRCSNGKQYLIILRDVPEDYTLTVGDQSITYAEMLECLEAQKSPRYSHNFRT